MGRSRARLLREGCAVLEPSTKGCFLRLGVGEVGASILHLCIYSGKSLCHVHIFMCYSASCTLICSFFAADMVKRCGKNEELLLGCGLESSNPIQ